LQCFAVLCSALQCFAVLCSALQCGCVCFAACLYFREVWELGNLPRVCVDTITFVTHGLAQCLCSVLSILWGTVGACLDVDLAERSTTCRSFGNVYVAFFNPRRSKPCFIRRIRFLALQCVTEASFLLQHTVAMRCRSLIFAATHDCSVTQKSPFCCNILLQCVVEPPFGRNTRLHGVVQVSFLLPTETHRCNVLQKLAFCCFPPQAKSILLQCSAQSTSIWNWTDLSAVPLQILNWMHSTTAIFHFYEKRPFVHEKRPHSCTRRSTEWTHPIFYASEPLERPFISMKQDLTADYREGGKKSWDHFLKNFHEPEFCTWDLRFVPSNNMVLITNSKRILVRLVLNWKFSKIISGFFATLSAISCT